MASDDFKDWTDEEVRQYGMTGVEPARFKQNVTHVAQTATPDGQPSATAALNGYKYENSPPKTYQPGKPDTTLGFNPVDLYTAGLGGRAVNAWKGLTGGEAEPTDAMLKKNIAALAGYYTPEIVASLMLPQTIPAQTALGAVSGGILEPGDIWERTKHATSGALAQGAGQVAANTIVKGWNAARGAMSPMGEAANAAEKEGINMTAGDILQSPVLRGIEKHTWFSPSGDQGKQIAEMMAGDSVTGINPLQQAVIDAHEKATAKVADLANVMDALPKSTKVAPYETTQALRNIYTQFPESFKNIENAVTRNKLLDIATSPAGQIPRGLTFSEMNDLAKAVGPIQAQFKAIRNSGAVGTGRETSMGWDKLYGSLMTDLENWGGKKAASQEVMDAYNAMKDTFKNEVLPLRKDPFASRIIYPEKTFQSPEQMLAHVVSGRNKTNLEALKSRLSPDGADILTALQNMPVGTAEAAGRLKGQTVEKPGFWRSGADALMNLATAAPTHLVNVRPVKAILKGSEEAPDMAYPLFREAPIFGGDVYLRRKAMEDDRKRKPPGALRSLGEWLVQSQQ